MENQVYGKELIEIQEIKFPVGPMIYAQMAKCIRDIAAVNKTKMIDGKKPYRGIDDITNAVKPVLGEHGIVPVSQVVGDPYFEERAQGKATYVRLCLSVIFYSVDGSHVDYLFWETLRSTGQARLWLQPLTPIGKFWKKPFVSPQRTA